ncbi:hypothetical protein F0919_08675 [Taibaiella lutea]|uniref:Gliding motility protein GldL-like N-terminal domain-containing protein n=1 Tax=Taibaiella lutea TaxID=2608001 RepID=A0A5M6CNF6_9BACT|nr:hypothetical protein [Taibaiella lutea]KAA5534679.1 hypothetical protein F0919_08675 [Taibaiella lutea]
MNIRYFFEKMGDAYYLSKRNNNITMRKFFLVATPILFFAALICRFLLIGLFIADILLNACFLLSFFYMYSIGTIKNSVLGRLSYIAISIFIIGLFFKLQHWPYSGILILFGLTAITVMYTIHFIIKRKKKLLDWIKVFAVFIKAVASMFWILHWSYREELSIASTIVLIALIAVFYIRVMKNDLNKDDEQEHSIANSGNDIFNYKS